MNRSANRKKWTPRRRIAIAIAVICFCVAVILFFVFQRRSLLDRSVRIADMRDWVGVYGGEYFYRYQWLTDGQVLMARMAGPEKVAFFRHDIPTGMETPLARFSARYNDTRKFHQDEAAQLSPDGKWLLWEGYARDGKAYYFCASLDGSKELRWPWDGRTRSPYPSWLRDGRRWFHQDEDAAWMARYPNAASMDLRTLPEGIIAYARIHDVEKPKATRTLTVWNRGYARVGGYLFVTSSLRWMLHLAPVDGISPVQQIERAGLGGDISRITRNLDDVRQDIRLFEAASVFEGSRVARVEIDGSRQSIIVSRPDGSERANLGGVTVDRKDYKKQITQVRWLPGGKRLSFEYNRLLYVVNVDGPL